MSGSGGGAAEGVKLLSLTTALGGDTLQATAFAAEEAISQPFSVQVELISTQSSIDPDAILYKPACLTVHRQHAGNRYFHGIVRAFAGSGRPVRGHWSYTAEIVPRLWFLGQTTDCRIFQGQTVLEIVTALCGEVSQTLTPKIFGDKSTQEYITQYNESDLDFLHRLMEQSGYHFHFLHTAADHVMVLSDQNQGFPAGPKPSLRVVHEGGGLDVLTDWKQARATTQGKVHLLDYDPAQPATRPTGQQATTLGTSGAALRDVFQWPARSLVSDQITSRARVIMEAAEASVSLRDTAGENPLLCAGSRFTLAKDPFDGAADVEYVVQRIGHRGTDESWVTGAARADYANELTVFPEKTAWRQPVITPRPVMAGVYAGIVLGSGSEDIHADKLGRVKVQMFFDHRSETTVDKAVWARVMQPWAGNSWGWQHLPRVGTEVAVSFMDGDPDRPVVMGGLYNGEMKLPFPVPGEQTKSGLRTRSSQNGGSSQFSELSFDDKINEELVFLHAERDMTVEVEHDQKQTVTNNRSHTVKQKETNEIGDSQTNTVKNGRTTTVNASGDKLTVGGGDLAIKVDMGAVTIEAMTSITLKVGQSTITIDQKGVAIAGMILSVEGQAMTTVKGPMTEVGGDAMLTLKGGITMIN